MKKLAAIFLLATFTLNLVGYRVWHYYELRSADQAMENILNKKDYLDADLVTIRIPLSLPYQTDTDDFERISGEVTFEGKIYKYVERKMEDGYFVLKCIADQDKTQLIQEKNNLVKSSLDHTQDRSGKLPGHSALKFIFSEFEESIFTLNAHTFSSPLTMYGSGNDTHVFTLHIAAPGQPPEILA